MKTTIFCAALIAMAINLAPITLHAQEVDTDSTGLDGDQFSLEGALAFFKKSESLEDFEKMLNKENNEVNNLDLNEDGKVDYIRVEDHMDGDVHAIVLQVPISGSEAQDVAVIELEKDGAESAVLQIIGDEDLYGESKIAEPFEEGSTKTNGRNGPAVANMPVRFVVNVWLWPSVRFVYRPAYRVYVSPWRWSVYPTWYRPFRPRPWPVYRVGIRPFRAHYTVVTTRRVVRARPLYAPHRAHATVVHTRTTTRVNGPRGGGYKKTTTTTKVRGRNGGMHQKTTVKAHRGGGRRH
jgi:hypothetical protein